MGGWEESYSKTSTSKNFQLRYLGFKSTLLISTIKLLKKKITNANIVMQSFFKWCKSPHFTLNIA